MRNEILDKVARLFSTLLFTTDKICERNFSCKEKVEMFTAMYPEKPSNKEV